MSYDTLFAKACLLQLSTSCWTGSRSLNSAVLESVGNTEWLKGKKFLINPELLSPIKTSIQKARQLLQRSALPFPLSGLYLIPKDSIADIDGRMDAIKDEYWDKVETFIDFYQDAREEARQALGDLFAEADYPLNMREKFSFEWRFVTLATPSQSGILTPEIYEREKEKFQNLMDEAKELSMAALREEFGHIVSHLVDRLSGNGDGKPKAFKSTMLGKMHEFLDTFGDRNVFEDDKLTELAAQAKEIVGGMTGYAISYNDVLRQQVTGEMGRLKSSIDAAIEELPRRRIRLDGDCLQQAA